MSKPSSHPIAYVFILWTDEAGQEFTQRYTAPHDGARQAADEGVRAVFGVSREYLKPGCNVRQVLVFENVEPRTFQFQRVTRPDFELREFGS